MKQINRACLLKPALLPVGVCRAARQSPAGTGFPAIHRTDKEMGLNLIIINQMVATRNYNYISRTLGSPPPMPPSSRRMFDFMGFAVAMDPSTWEFHRQKKGTRLQIIPFQTGFFPPSLSFGSPKPTTDRIMPRHPQNRNALSGGKRFPGCGVNEVITVRV